MDPNSPRVWAATPTTSSLCRQRLERKAEYYPKALRAGKWVAMACCSRLGTTLARTALARRRFFSVSSGVSRGRYAIVQQIRAAGLENRRRLYRRQLHDGPGHVESSWIYVLCEPGCGDVDNSERSAVHPCSARSSIRRAPCHLPWRTGSIQAARARRKPDAAASSDRRAA
jgi:hypothetical protein